GGEFSSDLLQAFCRAEGIRQTFMLPASPQQNGIAERRIGMVMDVTRTSMIHAAAPHFLWPFAVQYAAHHINLQLWVSVAETTPTLRWTGKVGDASAFRVWGSRAFVRDLSADKLSSRAVPCVFLGFPPDAPGWQFYHCTSRHVLSSQDITFDELVPYYRLFPYLAAHLPPPAALPHAKSSPDAVEPVEVVADSGAARGAEPAGAGSEGAEPEREEPGGTEFGGAEPAGVESRGSEPGGAESAGAEPGGAEPARQLREWFARRWSRAAGVGGATGAGGPAAAGAAGGSGATGPGGARTGGTGAAGAGAAGGAGAGGTAGVGAPWGARVGASGAAAGAAGAGGAARVGGAATGGVGAVPARSGGATRPRPYYVPLLQQVLGLPPSPGPAPSLECPPPHRKPESRPASPVCAARTGPRGLRQRPPPVPGTHQMALRPSTAPHRVPLPSPPASSLPALADPESNSLRAASPTVTRLLATVVTDPSFESTAASALVAELVDFAAHCRLDYAASLEDFECFAAAVPHLVSMLIAPEGDPDAPDISTPCSYAQAIEGPYSSQWQSAMDVEMASLKSTGTYVDEVPPPGANIVSGMWIFRLKRPPGSPPVFKARYVARGFSQRQGVDFFHTFSPTPKMTTLRVLLYVAAQRDYELHSLDFSTAFLQGSLHKEIWLCRPPGFTGHPESGTTH
ncbi:unnamed protein product, partial [Closterium sp. NIES-53]